MACQGKIKSISCMEKPFEGVIVEVVEYAYDAFANGFLDLPLLMLRPRRKSDVFVVTVYFSGFFKLIHDVLDGVFVESGIKRNAVYRYFIHPGNVGKGVRHEVHVKQFL